MANANGVDLKDLTTHENWLSMDSGIRKLLTLQLERYKNYFDNGRQNNCTAADMYTLHSIRLFKLQYHFILM